MGGVIGVQISAASDEAARFPGDEGDHGVGVVFTHISELTNTSELSSMLPLPSGVFLRRLMKTAICDMSQV